jgi:hypothetical protein
MWERGRSGKAGEVSTLEVRERQSEDAWGRERERGAEGEGDINTRGS